MKRKSIAPTLRYRVLAACQFKCVYCGAGPESRLEVDHILPVSKGGGNYLSNLTTACYACNRGKAARAGISGGFAAYLRAQADREDLVGDLARDHIRRDLGYIASLKQLFRRLRDYGACHGAMCAGYHAWREFRHRAGEPTLAMRRMQQVAGEKASDPTVLFWGHGL